MAHLTGKKGLSLTEMLGYSFFVVLCYLASQLVTAGPGKTLVFLAGLPLLVGYLVLIEKWPELAFPIILTVSSGLLGVFPTEKMPVLATSIGTVALLDLLILYPFFRSEFCVRAGKRTRLQTVYDGPFRFLLVMAAVAFLNTVLIQGDDYRIAVRMARYYLYYLSFFFLMCAVKDERAFTRLFRATALLTALGCAVQIGEFLTNRVIVEMFTPTEVQNLAYRVITLSGQKVTRYLTKTGNFALFLFFISYIRFFHEPRRRKLFLWAPLMLLSISSILIAYGRTLYLMTLAGLAVGYFLEREKRRDHTRFLAAAAGLGILLFAVHSFFSSGNHLTSFLLAIWDRFAGIHQDVLQGRDTFGMRMLLYRHFLKIWLQHLPLGAGYGYSTSDIWDIGFFCLFVHFGILAPIFYVWFLRNAIRRFREIYRMRLTGPGRILFNGILCYAVPQLAVLPLQDPFPVPMGSLLVIFVLVAAENIARLRVIPEGDETLSRPNAGPPGHPLQVPTGRNRP